MRLLITALVLITTLPSKAQELDTGDTLLEFRDGIRYEYEPAKFGAHFRFRIQNRFTYQTEDTERLAPDEANFEVRRTRLRLDGHVFDQRLLYRIQLSFTRGDFDYDRTEYPNILRDAAVGWKLSDKTTIWYGQTKLPGNRQRLVSSGSQQFVDRSLLNSTFNIDRDTGIFLNHKQGEEMPLWVKLAVSNGDGRSTNNKDSGLAYTARLEWLPLGNFKGGGDFIEGDLEREVKPKISFGAAYSKNKKATKTNGQTGYEFEDETLSRDMENFFADFLLKYRGFAWTTEYAKRWSESPVVRDSVAQEEFIIYKGQGFNTQMSYIFENNYEVAARFTKIWTNQSVRQFADDTKQYTVGMSKYINEHTVKIQSDLSYTENSRLNGPDHQYWTYRLQLEIGI
ncbi:MAG TPA: porin [Bacteriovoracaceae bacterium]|nr:porin [Bacteriovoracaceae bacterium]